MKNTKNIKIKIIIYSFIALSLLGLVFLPSQQKQKADENSRVEYINRIRQGLEQAQLNNTNPIVVVNSMANTLELRSDVNISPVIRQELITMETATINSSRSLIRFDRLVDILTDIFLQKAAELTSEEINQVITTARGFRDPSIPESFRNQDIGIFPGYYIQISDQGASASLRLFANSNTRLAIRPIIHDKIESEAKGHLADFALAYPSVFGQNWDKLRNRPAIGLSPAKAMLLTYSIISGDSFADNTTLLNARMHTHYQAIVQRYGSYASPIGHKPYGVNGYLFSSAACLFFDEVNQNLLLNQF